MEEDDSGYLVFWDEVKADYHPLLRDLRSYVNGARGAYKNWHLERIDELLEEEEGK